MSPKILQISANSHRKKEKAKQSEVTLYYDKLNIMLILYKAFTVFDNLHPDIV